VIFTPSVITDLDQIREWIQSDEDHVNKMSADWWLTGQDCLAAFCVGDDTGPTMYIRLDAEGELARIHIQFGPESEVSKVRTAKSLLKIFPCITTLMANSGFKGIVFESKSVKLIKFFDRLGFKHLKDNDYLLMLGG
jgi:hypothetical protein